MSSNLSRPSWKQCALLLILLSHAVFGSPIIPTVSTAYESLEPVSQADNSSPGSLHGSLGEDVFGPSLDERSDRKKRLLYDTLKKAKQAKFLTLGAASSGIAKSAAKKIGKSVLKTVATLGIKAIIFNFLYSTIVKLGLLKKVLNPLNAELFRQFTASAASHLPSAGTVYHFDPETSDFRPTDDTSSTVYTSSTSTSSLSSQSDSSSSPFTEPYDRSDSSSESETTVIPEESTSSKSNDSFGGSSYSGRGDQFTPERNYFELHGFEHRISKARQEYTYQLHEDTPYVPAESSPQEYYYTYQHARALPPPFGYNYEY